MIVGKCKKQCLHQQGNQDPYEYHIQPSKFRLKHGLNLHD